VSVSSTVTESTTAEGSSGRTLARLNRLAAVLAAVAVAQERSRVAERLASEAVAEMRATGAAVVDAEDRPIATGGSWPQAAVVRLAILGGSGGLHAILVGPRLDGHSHDPREVAELQEVARLLAIAVRRAPGGDA
jgi:hypothetical protein